jgi:hypothetical protein
VRTAKTSSGATAIQIVYSFRRCSREIWQLGWVYSDAEVELLKAAARQRRRAAGQGELDLDLPPWGWSRRRAVTRLPVIWSGADHRADQQAGQRPPAGEVGVARAMAFADTLLADLVAPEEILYACC